MIFVTFGEICLAFSLYNLLKNYLTREDTRVGINKICQSGFVSSPVSHLNTYPLTKFSRDSNLTAVPLYQNLKSDLVKNVEVEGIS